MKVGILTFHDADNYGAVLQAFALKQAVSKYAECCIINYNNETFHKVSNKKGIVQRIVTILHGNKQRKKKQRFDAFRHKYLVGTDEVVLDKDLCELNKSYDIFVSGSDQIWNLECSGKKDAYFLPFVENDMKKYSYAASFGTDKPELAKEYIEMIAKFNKISVREESGVKFVTNRIGRECLQVVDPTLLLKESEWCDSLNLDDSIKREKYILLYEVLNGQNMERFAKQLSAKVGIPVYCITASNRIRRGMKVIRNAGPMEWIQLIKNSSYVVTNSFHGLAFSLIFNKQFFVELLPPPAATNTRMVEMLKLVGLERRIISETISDDEIDYSYVNLVIDEERKKSIDFMEQMVGENMI